MRMFTVNDVNINNVKVLYVKKKGNYQGTCLCTPFEIHSFSLSLIHTQLCLYLENKAPTSL